MKLSDLKPCALCGGPLRKPPLIQWYVLRVGRAILNPRAVNQVQGMAQMMGADMGQCLPIIEALAPEADRAVVIIEDEPNGGSWLELHVCFDCFHDMHGLSAAFDHQDDQPPATPNPQ